MNIRYLLVHFQPSICGLVDGDLYEPEYGPNRRGP